MRYYQPFPAAIPLYEAGYPRVTHPSATNSEKQALHRPFDLHVLSTPPAFILSQDQTLNKMVFKWPQRSQSNRSYWSVPCFKENKLTLFLTSSFQSSLKTTITFWCFVFVTLFNLQGTRCVLRRFLMISLRFPFVKNFFRSFSTSSQVLSSARPLKFYHRRSRKRLI